MARFQVPPPPFVQAPHGLLDAATVPADDGDTHLWRGVEWDSGCAPPAALTYDGCLADTPTTDNPDKAVTVTGFPQSNSMDPFTVFQRYDCSPAGFTQAEHEQRARDLLARSDARAIEAVVERGTAGTALGTEVDGSLSQTATQVADVNDVTETIGVLERVLGWEYGGVGVLHMSRLVATMAIAANLLVVDRGRLRTVLGTTVAAGTGYLGTGAGGPSGASQAVYATGAVIAYRSAPQLVGSFRESLIREQNALQLITERTVVVGWDCGAWYGRVDTSGVEVTIGA
jgi:hypothetical protein